MIIHDVEQGSEEWLALRCGIPTASAFSKLVTSDGKPSKSADGYAVTLANEKYAGKPLDAFAGNMWTENGKAVESEAREYYQFVTGYDVQQVGFITDDDRTYGISPDSLVNNDRLLEIKCLKAENHTKALLYFKKHGRCEPSYVQQTQGQMMGTGRKANDLLFYHPDLPPLIIHIEPIQAVWDGLMAQIAYVNKERDRIYEMLAAWNQ